MKSLIKNRKGTAEVIGTMLFIIILLFFFTNVYMWHDTATKEANQFFLKKINSTFKINQTNEAIVVTANGGSGITLSGLWVIDNNSTVNTSNQHYYADLGNVQVAAGESFNINFPITLQDGNKYDPPSGHNVTCTVINTLGIAESTIFQPS